MSHCVFHCAWAERERASFSSGLSGFHKLRNPSLAAELSESRAGFRKRVQKITRRREVVSLFPGIVSSPSGLDTFLPCKQALFS